MVAELRKDNFKNHKKDTSYFILWSQNNLDTNLCAEPKRIAQLPLTLRINQRDLLPTLLFCFACGSLKNAVKTIKWNTWYKLEEKDNYHFGDCTTLYLENSRHYWKIARINEKKY